MNGTDSTGASPFGRCERGEEHESMIQVNFPDLGTVGTFRFNSCARKYKVERAIVETFKVWPHPDAGDSSPRAVERYRKLMSTTDPVGTSHSGQPASQQP